MLKVVKMKTISVIISFGSGLILLAIACVILMSNTVYTSEFPDEIRLSQSGGQEKLINTSNGGQTLDDKSAIESLDVSNKTAQLALDLPARKQGTNVRSRSGRIYGQSSGLNSGSNIQQVASPESYAAAYAAVHSPSPGDQQTNLQANDASAYTSFGESPPSSSNQQVTSQVGSSNTQTIHQILMDHASPQSGHSYYANYMSPSSNEPSYSHQQPVSSHDNYHGTGSSRYGPYHSSYYGKQAPLGYPSNAYGIDSRQLPYQNYIDRPFSNSMTPLWFSSSSLNPFASSSTSNGLMSSASHMLSHWTNGFSISEIICGIVALAIGAIILGAPFFLIYLALMGNFSGSGSLSLTNPGQPGGGPGGPPSNGRRKRLAIYEPLSLLKDSRKSADLYAMADSIANQISPYIDLQQVAGTLKRLAQSIEKYSSARPSDMKKKKRD